VTTHSDCAAVWYFAYPHRPDTCTPADVVTPTYHLTTAHSPKRCLPPAPDMRTYFTRTAAHAAHCAHCTRCALRAAHRLCARTQHRTTRARTRWRAHHLVHQDRMFVVRQLDEHFSVHLRLEQCDIRWVTAPHRAPHLLRTHSLLRGCRASRAAHRTCRTLHAPTTCYTRAYARRATHLPRTAARTHRNRHTVRGWFMRTRHLPHHLPHHHAHTCHSTLATYHCLWTCSVDGSALCPFYHTAPPAGRATTPMALPHWFPCLTFWWRTFYPCMRQRTGWRYHYCVHYTRTTTFPPPRATEDAAPHRIATTPAWRQHYLWFHDPRAALHTTYLPHRYTPAHFTRTHCC